MTAANATRGMSALGAEAALWAYRGLVIGTIVVLALDFKAIVERRGGLWPAREAAQIVTVEPVRAPIATAENTRRRTAPAPERFTFGGDTLRFEMKPDGVLVVAGSIEIGAAYRFVEQVERHGNAIRAIALDSPGGSLDDAMAIGLIIRERGYDTIVRAGATCASSCPLVLAGGVSRRAGEEADIGLHQFYAGMSAEMEPAEALSDAQSATARISRYLSDMGVDPALWLHALDTPPQSLYYLSAEEMSRYHLVTGDREVASR